jgi:prevent-host-death family protein
MIPGPGRCAPTASSSLIVLRCAMERVGVRELRQNASVLLDRVTASGESIEITNHGRPVALLVPIGQRKQSNRQEMIHNGLLRPGRGDPLAVVAVDVPAGSSSTDEILGELRDDR